MTDAASTPNIADRLLNDAEINLIADVFLAHLNADRTTRGYRLLRNAVILYSHGAWEVADVYSLTAACADCTYDDVRKDIETLINGLDEPPHITFDRAYAPPDVEYDTRPLKITMPECFKLDRIIEFFGTVLLYIIVTNYNKYDHINV